MEETLFKDALISLKGNRTRTLLSCAALAGGVFVLIFSIAGFNIFYNGSIGEISKLEQETASVSTKSTTKSYSGFGAGREWNLHKSDIDEILLKFPNTITSAGPVYRFDDLQLVRTDNGVRDYAPVLATHPEVCDLMQISMVYGRFIDGFDMQSQRKVCVVGLDLAERWFGDKEDPIGKDILVGNVLYKIVGVAKKDNPLILPFGNEQKTIILPYSTADAVFNLKGTLSFLLFSLYMTDGFEQRRDEICSYLRQLHQVDPDDTYALQVDGVQEYTQMLDNLFSGTRVLIWTVFILIVLSSLLGVFGIMLLSVRERRMEIGVRLSMGARPKDIIQQCVYESLIMSMLSSLSGVLSAELIIAVFRFLFHNGTISDPLFGLPQLSFTGIITVMIIVISGGILSGYFPARKMVNMNVSVLLSDKN